MLNLRLHFWRGFANRETTELVPAENKAQQTYATTTVTNSGFLALLKVETTRTLRALIDLPTPAPGVPVGSVIVVSRLETDEGPKDEADDDAAVEPQNDVPKDEDAPGDDAALEPQNDVPKEGPEAAAKASAITKVLVEEAAGLDKAAEAAAKENKTAPGKK
jgi:hypothetical protein